MASVEKIVEAMRSNPDGVRFNDAKKVADHYFGEARVKGSHHVYGTPWAGDPRVNLQNRKGKVAGYQVRQLLAAIDKKDMP